MRRTTPRMSAWRPLPILLASSALLIGACASDEDEGSAASPDDTSSVETTETTVDAAAALGEPNPASGDPIRIGYVYDGVSDSGDNTLELDAAQAATEYVNEYLGGIGGRPIELDVCETGQTPAGATDCVTQMVTDEVAAVLNGVTGQGVSLFAPLAEAGIPSFTPGTLDQESLAAPGIFIMGNGILTVLAGPAQIAANNGVERAAVLVIDVPAASGPLETAAPLFYGNVDVEVDIVTIPPDTPDMAPQIIAELANNPGQFQIIGDVNFCSKALRALSEAGFEGTIIPIQGCIDEESAAELTNVEGSQILSLTSTDPSSPEVQLFNAIFDTYAPDASRESIALSGYQAVIGFARAMAGHEGDVTPESVIATLEAMPPTPVPLADGITFQCNHTAVSIAPNICSTDVLQATLDATGNGSEYTVLEGTEVLTLGG
jgi:branched-chain amino acid transport system substrate-binding protein